MIKDVLKYLQPNAVIPIDMETTTALVNALKEALAQPEQEPVAWMWRVKNFCDWPNWSVSLKRPADSGHAQYPRTEGYEDIPLYTTAPQRTEPLIGCVNHDCDKCMEQQVERNFCPRCGKRTKDLTHIHTCTPPKETT
jgi:hypothetical protein